MNLNSNLEKALIEQPAETIEFIASTLLLYKPLSDCITIAQPKHIIKLEGIKQDLKQLKLDIGQFPHENKGSTRPAQKIKKFYTQELLEVIGPFLSKEARLLGYRDIKEM
jgi:hypothetical protein